MKRNVIPKAVQLPSGSWRTQVTRNGHRASFVCDTQEEAVRKALLFIANETTDDGEKVAVQASKTLRDAIDDYIDIRTNVLSPSTIRGYKMIQKHRFPDVMDKQLSEKLNWQAIVNAEAKVCSAKTLKNSWGLVRSVYEENGFHPDKVRLPQIIRNEHPFLDPEQITLFVDAIRGETHELAYLLCLHGLRRSEMLAVEKKDVTEKLITVAGAKVYDQNNELIFKKTNKNVSSRRTVPVLIDRLWELVQLSPDGLLVTAVPQTMFDRLNYVCRLNNLPEIGFHGLRHSFASLCYHLGISEMQAMAFGGWSDLTVMRKVYTHLSSRDADDAVRKLRQFFQPDKKGKKKGR